jgi:hypothetical protein
MIDTKRHHSIHWIGGLVLLLVGLGLTTTVRAQQPDKDRTPIDPDRKLAPNQSVLDVNNSAMWITREGLFDWNFGYTAGSKAGSFPARSGTGTIFAQGFMWGGKVKDGTDRETVRVNGATYETGQAPGGLNPDGTPENAEATYSDGRLKYRVYRVHRRWVQEDVLRNSAGYATATQPGNVSQSTIDDIRDQYKADWNQWPAEMGAPYEECGGGPGYQPADPNRVAEGTSCEDLNGDIPGRPGADQTMWLVTNDVGSRSPTDASRGSYSSPAIGVETQYTIWGYDRAPTTALGNIHFIEAKLIYQGLPNSSPDARIDSMFTTWWVDPDVGSAGNDFAGVDTSRSMGYAYNAGPTDGPFASNSGGLPPPAVGFDFLKGPKGLGLSSFVFFAAGSDISDPGLDAGYNGSLQWYNLMRGFKPRPDYPQADPFVNPITGEESKVTLPGNPVTGSGWIDGSTLPPGDRRIVNTAGPFSLSKKDTVSVVVGAISAIGSSNITSISRLRFFDSAAQFAFDQNFNIPGPPATPSVDATTLDEEVVLNWGRNDALQNRIESYTAPPGYQFEGYRVYQLPSPTASIEQGTRIATFDVDNNVRTLVDNVFEQESGFVVQKPVQSLKNQGIQRFLQITEDAIRDQPLANGVDYHFAVTSFGYLPEDADVPSRILESAPAQITVRPERPQPGTVDSTVASFDQEVPVSKGQGVGNAAVTTRIVDPGLTVDSDYTITIAPNETWTLRQGGADGTPLLADQEFGIQPDREVVNGLKVDVSGATFSKPVTIFDDFAITDPNSSLALWGDATLFGAGVGFYRAFNPNLPEVPVEDAKQDLIFRFTGNGGMESQTTEGGQLASYCERAAFGAPNPVDNPDLNCNVIRMPFELHERERDRQIKFAVVGRNADGNSPWGNGAAPDDGYYRMDARDYIIPIHEEYDQQEVQNNGTNPGVGSWLLFFRQAGISNASSWDTGDVYQVSYANPLVPGTDTWTFSTDSTETGNEQVAKETVSDIGVFPNPYRGFNRLEDSRFNKFVRFTRLPDPAKFGSTTIRIFTIAGNPVRVLEHTEDSPNDQFHDWNLENEGGVPVASGIYLVHVNTPVGEKTLKVAIVQEEEVLRRY